MNTSIYVVLFLRIASMDFSECVSERYLASDNLQLVSENRDENETTDTVMYSDISTLCECAMKSLLAVGSTFLYSKDERTCLLTAAVPPEMSSSQYHLYLRDDKDKYQRSCFYKMLRKQESYYREAKRKCQEFGGYVLEINSEEENNFVKELFKGVSVWLGAVQIREKNNTFWWERGGEMTFTDWASDYPIVTNNLKSVLYCAILTWGGWKNMYCSFNAFYVVCEFDRCIN